MVQPIDSGLIKPNYNAVKISIKKPEVNAGGNINTYSNDNSVYSAVNIEIDNPTVNTAPKQIYEYPEAGNIVTYDMANVNRVPLPQGFNLAYHTTNVIIPKMEQEIEFNEDDAENTYNADAAESKNVVEEQDETPIFVEIPKANYTTVEAEKPASEDDDKIEDVASVAIENDDEDDDDSEKIQDNIDDDVKIMEAETKELKRPEIIPGDEIQPDVDVPLVTENLASADFDIQAQQMEEIARISLDDSANAVPYIVREIFSGLIDITQKDTTNLAAPTDEQVEARKKLISNYIAMENSNGSSPKLPYKLTANEYLLANTLSPMEQAERNKEYALYTISILAKVYTDEVEKQTGDVVPLTDLPGSAAIVDALRYNPNAGVKIAAIDALRHIQRPEYKEELNALYTLAQADANPQVSMAATRAIEKTN